MAVVDLVACEIYCGKEEDRECLVCIYDKKGYLGIFQLLCLTDLSFSSSWIKNHPWDYCLFCFLSISYPTGMSSVLCL